MSLRARLAIVLAGLLVGPLVASWIVVAVVMPRSAAGAAQAAADRAVVAVQLTLVDRCAQVGDTARLLGTLTASHAGELTPEDARADAASAIAGHPGFAAAVIDSGRIVGATPRWPDQLSPAEAVTLSCARGSAPAAPVAALAESVQISGVGAPGRRAIVLSPIDAAELDTLALRLGDGLHIAVLSLGLSHPISGTLPEAQLAAAAAAGQRSGESGAWRFATLPAQSGAPYVVVVASPIGTSNLGATLAALVVAGIAVSAVLIVWLTTQLTRPLRSLTQTAERLGEGHLEARSRITGRDEVGRLATSIDTMADRLQEHIVAVEAGRASLAETFEHFGEALGRTHDLEGLLRTIVEAACHGAGAGVGMALLGDGPSAEEQISVVTEAAVARGHSVADDFEPMVAWGARAAAKGRTVLDPSIVATPILFDGAVVGALTVARPMTSSGFDERAVRMVEALARQAGTAVANVRAHETSRRLSMTDALTGVKNVRAMTDTLAQEVERAVRFSRPLGVLMMDLDRFKLVNDTHGHPAGDAVLREFAHRLTECVREVDTVARYGGEEFAILLPETDEPGAVTVALRTLEAVRARPFMVGDLALPITVSIGVATFPRCGRSGAEVMRAADTALYAAKHGGRNRFRLAEPLSTATGGSRSEGPHELGADLVYEPALGADRRSGPAPTQGQPQGHPQAQVQAHAQAPAQTPRSARTQAGTPAKNRALPRVGAQPGAQSTEAPTMNSTQG